MWRKIKDSFIAMCIVLMVVGAAMAVVGGMAYGGIRWNDYQCSEFCESLGNANGFNPGIGCFCVDDSGQKYNPKHLVPPGTTIQIVD